jgi:hypothetical protein
MTNTSHIADVVRCKCGNIPSFMLKDYGLYCFSCVSKADTQKTVI